jgi:hypothetical protein
MNTIEIRVSETTNAPDATDERGCIELQLLVDGIKTTAFDGVSIEPCALAAVATQSGEFYIATCGCGIADCAGIYRGVRVSQSNGIISWEVPVPYLPEKGSDRSQSGIVKYEFSADSYRAEIANMVDTLRSLQVREAKGDRFELHGHPGTLVEQILGWIAEGIVPF